jgi:hypothetical protein
MCLKKLTIGALLATLLSVSAHAATVSFLVIETGVREDVPTVQSSRLWEYALLDVFFDTGHIVSNAPIARVSERPQKNLPDEARSSLDEALEGGAEFFVVAVLDYQNPSQGELDQWRPRKISLRLFKTMPYRFLYSREYAAADLRIAESDEVSNVMSVVRAMAAHLRD